MTSDDGEHKHGFTESVRRFFWLPRQASRDAAPVRPLARVWVFVVAAGAGAAALGWGDMMVVVMFVGIVQALLDDVIKGVRHRWPAFVTALSAGWSADRLTRAVVSAPADPDWADWPGLVCGSLAAFATFVAVTHLPAGPRRA
ncbi:hypothetical protein ACFV2U_43985 [Streptomyces sp. NPDC059697]|uniref:hypothetical protein n=1 Tax=Streptomyces sp. NPDC059697 TaxID=3346912 RepID=UPI0036D13109